MHRVQQTDHDRGQAAASRFSINRWLLYFRDPEVEADFAARSLQASKPFIRAYLTAGVGLYLAFGILDAAIGGDQLLTIWLIRFGFVCPILLSILALTFTSLFDRLAQPALGFSMLTAGAGILAMTAVLAPPLNAPYYAGLIMVVIYCGSLIGLRFIYSTMITLFCFGSYQVVGLVINPLTAADYLNNNFFLFMATATGMFSSYMLETHIRNNYIAQKIIEEKNRVMKGLLDEAEAANRAKSEFLAVMSHELRTPLNAILGFSEMLVQQMLGPLGAPKYKEYAVDIHDSGSHLLSIINDILDLAKAESGKLELVEKNIDFSDVVESTLKMCAQKAHESNIKIEFTAERNGLEVFADERLVRQVSLNLISNAVKFTPAGGRVTIDVKVSRETGATLTVHDTGIGIAAKDLDRVLRPFEQVESALSRRHGGTGLGLPYSKKVVEIHGGSLKLASQVNKGTTVRVDLPASRMRGAGTAGKSAALLHAG
jgi:two-component system, cell cycle sensor histidine kinase PleC